MECFLRKMSKGTHKKTPRSGVSFEKIGKQ